VKGDLAIVVAISRAPSSALVDDLAGQARGRNVRDVSLVPAAGLSHCSTAAGTNETCSPEPPINEPCWHRRTPE
jgi:hypothetical protein